MRASRFMLAASALVTPLLLLPAPAAAQYSTDWVKPTGTSSVMIVGVVHEIWNGQPQTIVIWNLSNPDGGGLVRYRLRPFVGNGTNQIFSALTIYDAETRRVISANEVSPKGPTRYVSVLPPASATYSRLQFMDVDAAGNLRVGVSYDLASMIKRQLPSASNIDLRQFSGTWRTNLGTVLTLKGQEGRYVTGTSAYLESRAAGPTYAIYSWDGGNMTARLFNPDNTTTDLILGPMSRDRLEGETQSSPRGKPFVACRADTNIPYADDDLRSGSIFWARPERIQVIPMAEGKVRITATIRYMNVSRYPAAFQPYYAKGKVPMGQLRHLNGDPAQISTCDTGTGTYAAEMAPEDVDGIFYLGGSGLGNTTIPWDVSQAVAAATKPQAPSPAPQPAPVPTPMPAPNTPPSGENGPIRPVERAPAQLRQYSNYGIWDIKIEELAPGPDGNWQAVVRVRDAAIYKVGLTDDGVMLTMFDEDGRSVQTIPTLFRASVTGPMGQLEAIPQTMWMEKGDEIRVRLYFRQSAGFKPVKVRVGSNDRETLSRTFPYP